jgi:hypothetical protein
VVIVNVCPAANSVAPPDRFWEVLTATERLGEWVDGRVVAVAPPGRACPGQVIDMATSELGREWPLRIEVGKMDRGRRWIDFFVRLPFGVTNEEHLTLTERPDGGTLVRFN